MTRDHPLRRALRALLPSAAVRRQALSIQALGFEADRLDDLPAMLEGVGRELGLRLELQPDHGDLVLVEQAFVERIAPQVLHAFLEERPLLVVPGDAGAVRQYAAKQHQALVGQLLRLSRRGDGTVVGASTLPPGSGFDSAFDSQLGAERLKSAELDPDRAELLNALRRGFVDPSQPPLVAGYGRAAMLAIDFASGQVRIDELADQRLRVAREVPYRARSGQPGEGARARDIERVLWDVAVAAGGYRLLHSPVNWWHAPLLARPGLDIARFTRSPVHLELARCLAAAPASPSDLRRRARAPLTELRGFVQAALFLGLVHWLPATN